MSRVSFTFLIWSTQLNDIITFKKQKLIANHLGVILSFHFIFFIFILY
jgi:hypothetical protein